LIMSSEPDGCGELFQPHVLSKLRRIRELAPDLPIVIDGGVNLELLPLVTEAGAVKVVMGRAVFGAEDPRQFIESCSR
ncbi:MAG: ribulose-phosphate 3-epimerase, partial [Oscillospiraceae bacterium]|nr:ribulose-phosphate 3-epimerase [Oscillospiraceae bacterium]